MHIYDFITDGEQYKLKDILHQNPFEQRLKGYIESFMQNLQEVDNTQPSQYLNERIANDDNARQWFNDLLAIVRQDMPELERISIEISDVYALFISGRHDVAVTMFAHILEKNDLLDNSFSESLGGFFRGRWMGEEETITEESYFYHIPFTKRFLIKNQRFSFSGLPLLYAGQSLISVYYELGADSLNEENIASCLLGFDHLVDLTYDGDWERMNSRSKIYDISNYLYEIVNDQFYHLTEMGIKVPKIGQSPAYPAKSIRRYFRKFLISHFCTFPRTIKKRYDPKERKLVEVKDPHFIEEYVIPQLLMEAIRQHKYDGIIYPSTKFIGKNIKVAGDWNSHLYQTNIAMFSQYSANNPPSLYDRNLFQVLKVHTEDLRQIDKDLEPTRKIKEFNAKQWLVRLKEVTRSLSDFMQEKIPTTEYNLKLYGAISHIEKKAILYEKLTIDNTPYPDTLAGKIEVYYLMKYYQFIRTQFRQLNSRALDIIEEQE